MACEEILLSGNEAIGEGAIRAGCDFYAGYPITPQNELTAFMSRRMPESGRVFIQAESEISAINMVFGASAAGKRAMTSSSSPGISLKQEGISYLAACQLPSVVVNIMRGGPGLGNIAAAQSDYFQATRGGGHGDYHAIVLAPYSVEEAFTRMFTAFDLADEYRTPVLLLGDGMLGQMMEPVCLKDPGRAKSAREVSGKPWAITGCAGRKPNIIRSLFLKDGILEQLNIALQKKYAVIRKKEQRYETVSTQDASVVLVAYGTMARISRSVVARLRNEGISAGLIRPISLWPFPVKAFENDIPRSVKYLVAEMSYGQMLEDVRLAVEGRNPVHFIGRAGGGVPGEEEIIKKIKAMQ